MIRQVTLLALNSPSEMVREWAVEEFFDFGTSHAQRKGWAEDERTLEALLDAMLEIHQKDEFADRMAKAFDSMKFYFKTQDQSKTIFDWMSVTRWREEEEKISNSERKHGGDILFHEVKAELLLDESIATPNEVQHQLKEKYKREAEV